VARENRTVPSLEQADTGAAPCERRLIERLRLQHYAWRISSNRAISKPSQVR
jgi:hypothetical protein